VRPDVVTLDLHPAPDAGDLLMGFALARARGIGKAPFLLGGDGAFQGEEADPFLLMGAWPDDTLDLAGSRGPEFPWQEGAEERLELLDQFIDQSKAHEADESDEADELDEAGKADEAGESGFHQPGHGPLVVGWIGHELTATILSRHTAYLLLRPGQGTCRLVVAVDPTGPEDEAVNSARRRLVELEKEIALATAEGHRRRQTSAPPETLQSVSAPVDEALHGQRVEQILAAIRAGLVYQVNLAHPLHLDGFPTAGPDRVAVFLNLWRDNPVPYPAYLEQGDRVVISLSPERYLARRGKLLESRPIKGTRPRGTTPARDEDLVAALASSAKDRAENIMIVDLVRNDMGRVAPTGSVSVPSLCQVESFTSVHHLVSTVQAGLEPEAGVAQILAACHPPGSMTGAPKISAVKMIGELEGAPRGEYAGGLGWFAGPGLFHLSMVIRSVVVTGEEARLHVGGGIVADSHAGDEYQETLDKADAVLRSAALRPAGPGRT
jgi:anthranilate/para-aminobenzoate synthase component I